MGKRKAAAAPEEQQPAKHGGGDRGAGSLVSFTYIELYKRLFDQKGNKFVYVADGTCTDKLDDQSFYNILLLIAIVMSFAVNTSICERGFALMNNLKTARRSRVGDLLLRTLMTICELGKVQRVGRPDQDPH